ncbi:MAG TPA: dihydrofolate synthase [Saprospirales bacterium]|nr:dihydrofolate synthase [Saprospirales bacterium]HAY71980.1 dihydrofolate synthase [Saprospirales bacterium]HRQ29722.1 folylpolyglutamate synthase/dihydrofolate synthase family protein [Saprospiraceae bacterium]
MGKKPFPSYSHVIKYIFEQLPLYQNIGPKALRYDLQNISSLMLHLGEPHKKFPSIHIAGTNGKGTTAHILSAVFQHAGYKTGLYTSPHYIDFRERIRLNGQMIPENFVLDFFNQNAELIKSAKPSYFELSVALAFEYFASQKVDIAIIEVGLGGRLDSTNIIGPLLSVITNISLDHTQILGNTIGEIAYEKAGIIKPAIPVVIGERHPESEPVFKQIAGEKNASIYFTDEICDLGNFFEWGETFMNGPFLPKNIRCALSSVLIFKKYYPEWSLPLKSVIQSIQYFKKLTNYIGRWQVLSEQPLIIADGAHNLDAWEGTVAYLQQIKYAKLYFVMGFVNDKAIESILRLLPKDAFYFFCQAKVIRALPAGQLFDQAKKAGLEGTADYPSVADAFEAAKNKAEKDDLIFIGGSIFVVGEIL